MAIVNNMWLRGSDKKLGGTVLYSQAGRTLQRELAAKVSNPRTAAQMSQRVKLANLVGFYRANARWMRYAFESKKATQSEYNKLVSLNLTGSQVALTKEEAAGGAAVVAPYLITQGSLPPIEVSGGISNLSLGTSTIDLRTISVAAFSQALLANNLGLREGMQVSFVQLIQQTADGTGFPYIVVREYEVLIDTQSSLPLSAYWPVADQLVIAAGRAGESELYLGVAQSSFVGGYAFILSETRGGKTFVSSESVVLTPTNTTYGLYSSAAQQARAVASYGETAEPFLDSNAAAEANSGVAITGNVLSFGFPRTGGGKDTIQNGGVAPQTELLADGIMYVKGNVEMPLDETGVDSGVSLIVRRTGQVLPVQVSSMEGTEAELQLNGDYKQPDNSSDIIDVVVTGGSVRWVGWFTIQGNTKSLE